jgi:DNA (cytosine-5)-methyltransferase 1
MGDQIRVGSLFSGYDGIGLGLQELWPEAETQWFVEFDKNPSKILNFHWPEIPNLGDITAVDWKSVPQVDILTGGFPCQDLSHAGKGAGLMSGTRSGLWENFAVAIQELQPALVVIENVRGLISAKTADSESVPVVGPKGGRKMGLTRRALGRVLWDLAYLGYDASWAGVRASDAGAPHQRLRIFILAWPTASDADHTGLQGRTSSAQRARELLARAGGVVAGSPSGGLTPIPAAELLPTPAVNDMGDNKTVEWWEEWAPRQMSSEGKSAPHGRSLAIELMKTAANPKLLPTPTVLDSTNTRNSTAGRTDPDSKHHSGTTLCDVAYAEDFGVYEAAVRRWEPIIGRPAPPPTESSTGKPRLNPVFSEWMMGLPEGHVTNPEIGLNRTQQLRAIGNGVVPIQAARALGVLTESARYAFDLELGGPGRKMTSTPGLRGLVLLELLEPGRYEKALDAISNENPWVWNQLEEYARAREDAIEGLLLLQELEPERAVRARDAIQVGHPGVWNQLEEYLAANREKAA